MTEPTLTNDAEWTIARLLQWTQQYLAQKGVDEARLATELLLSHALGCKKIELYTRFETVPPAEKRTAFRELVQAAAEHAPVAYLVGYKEFFSLGFEVTPAVLIPRPETEALVVRGLQLCKERGWTEPRFLDVGAGSGCIAVTLLKHLPAARAVATDISAAALEVARRNAARHGVEDRVTLVEADRLHLGADRVPAGGFDFLVSNPPYIADRDLAGLPRTIRDHEPTLALSAGPDGLAFYRDFAASAPVLLRPDGAVVVEIGYDQEAAVRDVFLRSGRWTHGGTWRDPGDPHDRVMEFRLAPSTS